MKLLPTGAAFIHYWSWVMRHNYKVVFVDN